MKEQKKKMRVQQFNFLWDKRNYEKLKKCFNTVQKHTVQCREIK